MRGWTITRFPVRKNHLSASPLLLQSSSPTAATTAATPMNSAERCRTYFTERPMIYWQNELQRTILKGPSAHGMQGVEFWLLREFVSTSSLVGNRHGAIRPRGRGDDSAVGAGHNDVILRLMIECPESPGKNFHVGESQSPEVGEFAYF
jgi:hypothetical protein